MSDEQIKILCIVGVEDGKFYQRLFERSGYVTLVEQTGKDGVKKAIEFEPDLIVLSHHLPDYWGPELATEIREIEKLQDIPILLTIIIGSGPGYPYGEWENQSPLNKIIVRPVHISEFLEKTASLLEISGKTDRS